MADTSPIVVVLGGPNGAGKSTSAPALLRGTLKVHEFVNADVIARGISAFNPDAAAIAAGRVMLARLRELAQRRMSFAFETTLASRSFAPWISGLMESGYRFHLVFLWLPSADFALDRVRNRVHLGGHDVPEQTVRRRYDAGLRNLQSLYLPLATSWRIYNNAMRTGPGLVATGLASGRTRVYDRKIWTEVNRSGHEPR